MQKRAAAGAAAAAASKKKLKSNGKYSSDEEESDGSASDEIEEDDWEDADLLTRMQARGWSPTLKIYMEAQNFEDKLSYNVISDLPGSELPEGESMLPARPRTRTRTLSHD